MAAITLSAVDASAYFGAGAAGFFDYNPIGIPFSAGSISGDVLPSYTTTALLSVPNPSSGPPYAGVAVVGDATAALAGLTAVRVAGVDYAVIDSPVYDGTNTSFTTGIWAISGGNDYSVELIFGGSGPASPNITSPSTVPNLIGTKLAHTVTIDKTAASMAITGGADSADFEVTGTTGLRFVGDALSDTAGNLVVEVTVTDTDGLTATQTITVPVKYILYVGGKVHKRSGSTSAVTVSLTDLKDANNNAITLQENDLVLIGQSVGSTADRTLTVGTGTDYVKATEPDLYANGTSYDANLGVFYKVMGSTPDTSVSIGSTGATASAQATSIRVYRGVNPANPMDVALVTATGTGTAKPNPPTITPITTGAMVVAFGAQAAATMANLASSDLDNFHTDWQAGTQDSGIGVGDKEWSGSGSVDPAVFTGGSNNSANSWAAVTVALRPAYNPGGPTAHPYSFGFIA